MQYFNGKVRIEIGAWYFLCLICSMFLLSLVKILQIPTKFRFNCLKTYYLVIIIRLLCFAYLKTKTKRDSITNRLFGYFVSVWPMINV